MFLFLFYSEWWTQKVLCQGVEKVASELHTRMFLGGQVEWIGDKV